MNLCRLTPVMRRLLAVNLTVVLLLPWIAALSGAAAPIVPCPMHRSAGPASQHHAATIAVAHHVSAEHQSGSHHETSARGCNCAGECGRSGAAFSLPANDVVRTHSSGLAEAIVARQDSYVVVADHSLPLATGPPRSLQA
ncbi:MAG: hypothetical protein M3Z54_13505 [Gemmatimonadota bacterium]|nr:hypothetical protein [Gemmatimonadota bacterium]